MAYGLLIRVRFQHELLTLFDIAGNLAPGGCSASCFGIKGRRELSLSEQKTTLPGLSLALENGCSRNWSHTSITWPCTSLKIEVLFVRDLGPVSSSCSCSPLGGAGGPQGSPRFTPSTERGFWRGRVQHRRVWWNALQEEGRTCWWSCSSVV